MRLSLAIPSALVLYLFLSANAVAQKGPKNNRGPSVGAVSLVDSEGTIVGPLVDDRRVLLEANGTVVSIAAAPFSLDFDPRLAEDDGFGGPFWPDSIVYFSGVNCTGSAFYGFSASQLPARLIELGLVINGNLYARDSALAGDSNNFSLSIALSFYQVLPDLAGGDSGCNNINGGLNVTGIPAVTRTLSFVPPFTARIR